MAKRRQLEAPSPEALREIEEGFARETRPDPLGLAIPIASVAAEAAALGDTNNELGRRDIIVDGEQSPGWVDHDRVPPQAAWLSGLAVPMRPLGAVST